MPGDAGDGALSGLLRRMLTAWSWPDDAAKARSRSGSCAVMRAQRDLVRIVRTLRPVLAYKAV